MVSLVIEDMQQDSAEIPGLVLAPEVDPFQGALEVSGSELYGKADENIVQFLAQFEILRNGIEA